MSSQDTIRGRAGLIPGREPVLKIAGGRARSCTDSAGFWMTADQRFVFRHCAKEGWTIGPFFALEGAWDCDLFLANHGLKKRFFPTLSEARHRLQDAFELSGTESPDSTAWLVIYVGMMENLVISEHQTEAQAQAALTSLRVSCEQTRVTVPGETTNADPECFQVRSQEDLEFMDRTRARLIELQKRLGLPLYGAKSDLSFRWNTVQLNLTLQMDNPEQITRVLDLLEA